MSAGHLPSAPVLPRSITAQLAPRRALLWCGVLRHGLDAPFSGVNENGDKRAALRGGRFAPWFTFRISIQSALLVAIRPPRRKAKT
jgi:hypothetical protein